METLLNIVILVIVLYLIAGFFWSQKTKNRKDILLWGWKVINKFIK